MKKKKEGGCYSFAIFEYLLLSDIDLIRFWVHATILENWRGTFYKNNKE